MEQLEMEPKDLVPFVGTKSLVSRLLNKKRVLSLDVIRKLSEGLKLPADVLVKEYKIVRP